MKKLRSTEMKNGLLKEPRREPLFPHKEAFKAVRGLGCLQTRGYKLSLSGRRDATKLLISIPKKSLLLEEHGDLDLLS